MKRAQLFLKCGLSVLAQLEKDKRLITGFDFFFPAIDRFHARQNIRARSELFCDQLIRNFSRRFGIWKRAEREQNFLGHLLCENRRLTPTDPAATENNVVAVNYCGLSGRHRALRLV